MAGLFVVAVIALASTVACTPVKDLDDNARISSVIISAVVPSTIVLGNPQIEDEEVTIPVIFGKYLFPMEIQVEIASAQNIDNIFGLGPNKNLLFESLHDINRVDLVALSGMVHSYIFRLEEVPSSENADIEKFEVLSWSPESFLFVQTPSYDIINGTIEILCISDHFPFTIFPFITVSEGAYKPVHIMPENYTFTSYDTQIPLIITSESGKERLWHIKLKQAQTISPLEAPNADIRERLSLQAQNVSFTFSGGEQVPEVVSMEVDVANTTIRLTLKSDEWGTAWTANLSFPVNPYMQVFNYQPGELFPIQGEGIQKSFYLLDMIDGYAAIWKIETVRWLSSEAEIESFEVMNYSSELNLMELGTPIVYNILAEVVIPVLKGFDFSFPLEVDGVRLTISKDAQISEPLHSKLTFYDYNTQFTLTVTAQDGTNKQWTITLSDMRSGNSEARVLGYTIQSYSGTPKTDNNLIFNPQATINQQDYTIALHIVDGPENFPLTINGSLDISSGALLMPLTFSANHEVRFQTLDDSHTFTIISENGETERTWHIVLQNDTPPPPPPPPPKSSAKELIDFISGAPSVGFQFAEKYLEVQKRQITLIVRERNPNTSLILAPRITVSPEARLIGIVSGAQLSLSFDEPKYFSIQAEDEGIDEWSIVAIYAPQIPNSDFESWGKANNSDMNLLPSNGTGWCTANNSNMSNTSRVAGYNSPYAVQMQTLLQTLNFVIFKVTTVSAATAFLGSFTLKTGKNDVYNPISMTNMGLPFTGTTMPVAFSLDFKYIRGAQLIFTEPKWNSLIPAFENPRNISGTDAANMRVELFHNTSGYFNYVFARAFDETIAKGEVMVDYNVPEWTHLHVPIEVIPGKEGLLPTHIVIVLTSSHEGDYFKGAHGSTLTADNFNLIYYRPEEGAKRLE